MIDFFQITGSSSFAVRAALEEGGIAYRPIDIHPRRRDETPGFRDANPLARVPTIRDGDTTVYETAAVLLYLVERFPEANLGPQPGTPGRGDLLRWMAYLSNTVHTAFYPIQMPGYFTDDPSAHEGVARIGVTRVQAMSEYLEGQLAGRDWCLAQGFSVADLYLYMLKGWEGYNPDETKLGGRATDAHFARVGARSAVAATRELDDLDERLQRHRPDFRGGQPL
jgi:glutathione S-transferase